MSENKLSYELTQSQAMLITKLIAMGTEKKREIDLAYERGEELSRLGFNVTDPNPGTRWLYLHVRNLILSWEQEDKDLKTLLKMFGKCSHENFPVDLNDGLSRNEVYKMKGDTTLIFKTPEE